MITIVCILLIALMMFAATLRLISFISERKKNKLCLRLSKEGASKGLIFCSQEVLADTVIGIDGIHRKILVVERKAHRYHCTIISLEEVHHCQLLSNEGLIRRKNFSTLSAYLKSIVLELRFEFNNSHETASIIFAKGLNTSKRELELLRAKAEFWSVMFSKMLTHRISARA